MHWFIFVFILSSFYQVCKVCLDIDCFVKFQTLNLIANLQEYLYKMLLYCPLIFFVASASHSGILLTSLSVVASMLDKLSKYLILSGGHRVHQLQCHNTASTRRQWQWLRTG